MVAPAAPAGAAGPPSVDLRRAPEDVLLQALRARQPLALAEVYHRTIPAGHAVARRLLSTADDVEDLLLEVYRRLWASPPATGPLEGWVRRSTWALGVERLRAAATAPSSPSAAGLVPDLPAPDVRFLDAAERALAELPDPQRRALLLAHDKGVPADQQEDGAPQALVAALVALAGPETSAADRDAVQADPCEDLAALGDWCLGIADDAARAAVEAAVEARPGCAAVARAVRRGRRRIEGLPATPDVGQRVLVRVLAADAAAAPPADDPGAGAADPEDTVVVVTADEVPPPVVDADVDPFAPPAGAGALTPMGIADPAARSGELPAADVDAVEATGELPAAAAEPDDADPDAGPDADTRALPAEADEEEGDVPDWRPDPGSTAELRLSDILAEGEDEDDPFAALDADGWDEEEPAVRPVPGGDPYAALRGLGDPAAGAQVPPTGPFERVGDPTPVGPEDELVDGYVEGDEDHLEPDPEPVGPRSGGAAVLLSWVLPAIGGSLLGALGAILVFGPP
jgi:DNA-directed RNA polymerase specialized sigma24 family protein